MRATHTESDEPARTATRRMFGRLTRPHEDATDLRRRIPVADLGDDPAMLVVVEQFTKARLLTVDRDVTTREPTVEVAHEALLREWPRLAQWLDEDRALLRSVESITIASSGSQMRSNCVADNLNFSAHSISSSSMPHTVAPFTSAKQISVACVAFADSWRPRQRRSSWRWSQAESPSISSDARAAKPHRLRSPRPMPSNRQQLRSPPQTRPTWRR